MKIHIIGGSGSGKTYLARMLSQKYNIPHYDLDGLFWDNSSNHYGKKNTSEKRDALLKGILHNKDWIIEGVYYSWLTESFEKADIIIILDVPKRVCKSRIIRRFFKRKIGLEHVKKESIKSILDLLKWADRFEKVNLPEIYTLLEDHNDKITILRSAKQVRNYITVLDY